PDPGSVQVLAALPPDPDGGRLLLELTDHLDSHEGARAAGARALLLGALSGVGLVFAVAASMGHLLVTRPLRRVSAFVARIQAGDVTTRLPARGTGEVVALERALNHLCDRLVAADAAAHDQARAAAQAAEDLRRADRLASVGKLSAGIAHELGTPLNVILVRAKAIARAPDEPAQVTRQATIVAEQAERLIKIVRGLLDFSRRRPPHLGRVDVRDVVRGVLNLLEPQARAADVTLRPALPDALPSVRADAGQLEQVVTNLVMNAIQASPGGGDVTVTCARERAAPPASAPGDAPTPLEVVRLDVVDQGVGIPRDDLPRIFEPFFTTKQPGEGTGLGLSVAWGIVREHGGWFEVDSREAEGSRLSVLLPVAGPAEATA
ncbi:MAG: HAMP domain-containing protein, partial [Planctomycetota bacterium]|nr:HAMP domain-containing protein [Planctomycetota bacterium]